MYEGKREFHKNSVVGGDATVGSAKAGRIKVEWVREIVENSRSSTNEH